MIEAVLADSGERDAVERLRVYAALGIEHCWVVRGDIDAPEVDGLVTQYELVDGEYRVHGHRLASALG